MADMPEIPPEVKAAMEASLAQLRAVSRQERDELQRELDELRSQNNLLATEVTHLKTEVAEKAAILPLCFDPGFNVKEHKLCKESFKFNSEVRMELDKVNSVFKKMTDDGSTKYSVLKAAVEKSLKLLDLRLVSFHAAAGANTGLKAEFVYEYFTAMRPKLDAGGKWASGEKDPLEIQTKLVNEIVDRLNNQAKHGRLEHRYSGRGREGAGGGARGGAGPGRGLGGRGGRGGRGEGGN